MRTFALKRLEVASGRIGFYQLVIDDVEITKDFRDQLIDSQLYETQYKRIFAIISLLSNEERVSGDLNHSLSDSIAGGPEYEIRTKDLRAYYFKHADGKVITHFGFKKNQKQDIKAFRNLKKEFLQST